MTYLTTEDIAASLHLSNDTVRRMCSKGTIVATKVGRQWLVDDADFDGFRARYRGRKVPSPRADEPKRGRRRVA